MKKLLFGLIVLVAACGGEERPSRYPPREPGCAVTLYHGTPPTKTVNIGPVSAQCDQDVSEADCIRTLEDQVCKIGGDVVWGVNDTPGTDIVGHKKFSGRAAHTKASAPAAPSTSDLSSADAGI